MGHEERREGVQFPERDGRRSSLATGRRIFASAARASDAHLASRIESTDNWRKQYLAPVRALIETGIRSSSDATLIAHGGLKAAQSELTFVRGDDELSIGEAFSTFREDMFQAETIEGVEQRGAAHVSIPYRGGTLAGDGLQRQLDNWERAGVIEPSCVRAIREVLASPEWLDLSDLHVVMLGAASEMGPLTSLCSWGANVIAVDLPRPHLWRHIIGVARKGCGRLLVPTRITGDHDDICNRAGADLLTQAPEVRTWLAGFDVPLTVGNYVYADGGNFVCLATAVDTLIEDLSNKRTDLSIAYLATPTDVYAVPSEVASAATSQRPGGGSGTVHAIARAATHHRLYSPNYAELISDEEGRSWGISDCLVPQQGPNYALAKALQRWRAITARDAGHISSANLAPATITRSVMSNRVLAAAYTGAPSFGVEIFEPATSAALMATLLVHDLRNGKAAANPNVRLQHPFELWTDAAAHGGLLRLPYEPRSVLPLAALRGLLKVNRTKP